jgi:mRNA-degrading endonuclease toxin of MazEF toxin-antitoxin module
MNYKQRDIINGFFWFSDFSGGKRRPLMILSPSNYNSSQSDITVCLITSSTSKFFNCVLINNSDLETGTLPKDSAVRYDKITSIDKSFLSHYFGKLNMKKSKDVARNLQSFIDIIE